jgi:hypothetical protein
MQKINGQVVFSASDLVHFLDCEHLTSLDLIDLDKPLQRADDDAQEQLVQKKGFEHEARRLQSLQRAGVRVRDLKAESRGMDESIQATAEAMRKGAETIYQTCLRTGPFLSYADFLRRVNQSAHAVSPGPAKYAPQEAPHTIGCCNASVEPCRPEAMTLPEITAAHYLGQIPCSLHRIIHAPFISEREVRTIHFHNAFFWCVCYPTLGNIY